MSDPELERLLAEARRGMPAPPPEAASEPSLPPPPALPPALAAAAAAVEAGGAAVEAGGGAGDEGLFGRLLQLRTASILTARYVDLKLADLGGTLILIAQAPLIGFLVGLAFDGKKEDARLQFVLAMVAVWFGTFNSCREVVKERLIFLRERRTGVPIRAYLVSKIGVLSFVAALQCLFLVALVGRTVRFDSNEALVFLALFATALSSTCLGLFLSSAVKSQNSLIALVPIVLIPQLIFSDVVLGSASEVVERIQLVMMAEWGLEILRELRKSSTAWLEVLKGLGVLLGMGFGFLLLAAACLRAQEE